MSTAAVNTSPTSTAHAMPDNAREPGHHPRRILLTVTGLTPQVVTETLYGLVHLDPVPFIPTEIHVVTTAVGAKRVRLLLLDSRSGAFKRFCSDFGLGDNAPRFDESTMHVLRGEDGTELSDIDSEAAHRGAADQITRLVASLTSDPDCAVHASVAGGRKTMGFYLGYALSLHGRGQDRLSHVLVSEPFESEQAFYYPPREDHVLVAKGRPVHTSEATVTLANIPFVRLRAHLGDTGDIANLGFDEAIHNVQQRLAAPGLRIDLRSSSIEAAGKQVRVAPARLALLTVFARRRLEGEPPTGAPSKYVPDPDWGERYLREYVAIRGPMGATDNTEEALAEGMSGEYFSSQLSNLRRTLRSVLGVEARPYLIDDGGRRPHRYELALAAENIEIIEPTCRTKHPTRARGA